LKVQVLERDQIYAIIPVNVIRLSKGRLSPILNSVDRARLMVAMLKDVLSAVGKVRMISRVTVVSADMSVRKIARAYNANFIWEGTRRGLNKGVRLAILASERKRASAVVVVHADLPLANSREISRFLSRCANHSVGLVPSRDGNGTNALFLKPPGILRPVFGRRSFWKHQSLAKQSKLAVKVVRSSAIGFDVDEPKDLRRLQRCRVKGETGKLLRTIRDDHRNWQKPT
jgi:2-phospho-L-lactate guanylyltransferase